MAERADDRPRLLMVPPAHFSVLYEINPWMDRKVAVSPARAAEQWSALHGLLAERLGADVRLAEPLAGLPDMVFTANAGLIRGSRAILSSFRHPERQGEAPLFGEWFRANGFEVETLPEGQVFEGEGDALFAGDTLFAGYYWRSDVAAHTEVAERLGVRVLSLQLVDAAFYHLDTCFCPLDAATVAYYPPAFDEYARRVIEANFSRRIELEPDEAGRFAANAVVLGRSVVLNTGCPRFEAALEEIGFTPYATPLDEFLKAGGSAKCLTLLLDHPG
ncbi:MAG: amidinotransferase [Armatimonadetes bacterium]|jgi:N-dimethylarginine dimethylaminohydrolase|nr:amidinotransferase [Armatimonadota bacterium]